MNCENITTPDGLIVRDVGCLKYLEDFMVKNGFKIPKGIGQKFDYENPDMNLAWW